MHAHDTTLQKFIREQDRILGLPRYQRRYDWPKRGSGDDFVTELFDDLLEEYELDKEGTYPTKKFLGAIVSLDKYAQFRRPSHDISKMKKKDLTDQGIPTADADGKSLKVADMQEILVQRMSKSRCKTVDGQQRLTTIFILLICLYIFFDNEKILGKARKKDRKDAQDQALKIVSRDGSEPRISLKPDDAKNLRKFLADKQAYTPVKPKGKGNFNVKVDTARKKLNTRIERKLKGINTKKKRIDFLIGFTDYIIKSMSFVVVEVTDELEAHRIFMRLNSTGMSLRQGDLIYAHIQYLANKLDPEWEVNVELDKLEQSMGFDSEVEEDKVTTFFWYYYRSIHGACQEKHIFDNYKTVLNSILKGKKFTRTNMEAHLTELNKEAKNFRNLNQCSWKEAPDSLQDLNVIGIVQFLPIFMSAIRKDFKDDQVKKLFRFLETMYVRRQIAGGTTPLEGDYVHFANNIHTYGADYLENDQGDIPSMKSRVTTLIKEQNAWDDNKFVEFMKTRPIKDNGVAKFLIRKALDVKFGGGYYTDRWTLEHIVPKSPKKWTGTWKKKLGGDAEEKIHLLGNMLIMTQGANSKISNEQWGVKKNEYKRKDKHGEYLHLKHVYEFALKNKGWDEEKIQDRTDKLVSKLPQIWPKF